MSDLNGAPEGAAEHLSTSEGGQESVQEHTSTRDAVAAAFAKLEQPQGDEAGQGTQEQRPASADGRARDEHGRFAAGQRAEGQGQTEQKPNDGKQPQPDQRAEGQPQDQSSQPTRGAPPGWSPASKDAYAKLPDCVKADIAKREQEVNTGLSELREYRDLRPFRDMAQRSGTNLTAVLSDLSSFEDTIAKDPVQAIGRLAHLYGFDLRQAVTGLSQALGMQPQEGQGGQAARPQQMALPPEVLARLERVDRLEQQIYGQQRSGIEQAISTFASDPANEFFDNVGNEVAQIIASDLQHFRSMPPHLAVKEAYDKAVWLNPDTRAVLIKRQSEAAGRESAERMQATAHQARQQAKGLSGSPVNGATPGSKQPLPTSTRDAVSQAWDMHADI